jgi:hypothetical protein
MSSESPNQKDSEYVFRFMDASKLQLVILRSKDSKEPALQSEIYSFWHQHWSQTYREIGRSELLHADDFLRQEEVAALFYDKKPIASILFDWLDVTNPVHQKHSFFYPLDDQKIANLSEKFQLKSCIVFNFLAVDQAWRKNEISIADLILGLAVKRFESSNFKNVIAFCRNTRKANELMHRHGGISAIKDLLVNSESSDFGVFNRSSILDAEKNSYHELIQKLWKNRIMERSRHPQFKKPKQGENI